MPNPVTPKAIDTPVELGALLRARRKAQRLTLEDLSGLSGLGIRFLSELERGKPTAELGKAMHALSVLGLELYAVDRARHVGFESELARACDEHD